MRWKQRITKQGEGRILTYFQFLPRRLKNKERTYYMWRWLEMVSVYENYVFGNFWLSRHWEDI